jgi:hypothetical protein
MAQTSYRGTWLLAFEVRVELLPPGVAVPTGWRAARGRVAESPGEGEGCRGAEGEGGEGACAADGLQWYVLGG